MMIPPDSLAGCKAVITKIDKYDIHLNGDNCYRSASTREEAEKIAKAMESEALAEFEKANSEATKERKHLELLDGSLRNYVCKLMKELWTLQHLPASQKTATTLTIIENMKEEIKNLRCDWHNGIFRDSDSYSIEPVKDEVLQ
jgi:hypothetical protein